MAGSRTKREARRLKAEIRSFLADGLTDRDMAGELNITLRDLRNLKRELVADELEQISNDTPAEVWAKYRLRMDGCIADLDDVFSKASDVKVRGGLSAAVNAVKAKATIIDNVLKKGQELGVIHKEPDKRVVSGGITVTSVNLVELRELVDCRKAAVEDMVKKYAPESLVDYADEHEGDLYPDPSRELVPVRRKVVSK